VSKASRQEWRKRLAVLDAGRIVRTMRITVDHPYADELSQQSWFFYVTDNWHGHDGIAVVLDNFIVSTRRSVSAKFRAERAWSRWGTHGFGSVIRLENAPHVPQWVRTNVIMRINESSTCLRQSDTPTLGTLLESANPFKEGPATR
jgi:hypothetical protein